jgi:hypothetical protein
MSERLGTLSGSATKGDALNIKSTLLTPLVSQFAPPAAGSWPDNRRYTLVVDKGRDLNEENKRTTSGNVRAGLCAPP